MKKCRKCKKQLDESEFHKSSHEKDGLQCYCKECKLSILKQYRLDHPDYSKQYRKDHPDYMKQYRKDHRDRLIKQMKQYNGENEDRLKQYRRQYNHENPDSVMLANAKKRAKKFNREFNIARADIKAVYTLTCHICGKEMKRNTEGIGQSADSPTLDRIDNDKGYVKGNIQIICQSCNTRKDKK